jgi:hypothetical protein
MPVKAATRGMPGDVGQSSRPGADPRSVARRPEWLYPGWPALLPLLIRSCRTIHEVFVSYMSLSLARSRHPDLSRSASLSLVSFATVQQGS